MIRDAFQRIYRNTGTGETSNSIPDLLTRGGPFDLDLPALNVFLRSGLFIGDSTPFTNIRTSLPDVPQIKECGLSRRQIIDAYIELFRQAMRRCLDSHPEQPYTLGLSGGRDSRHILLEACFQQRKPQFAWTIDLPGASDDFRIAKILAAGCEIQHRKITIASGIEAERRKNRLTNFCSQQHTWIVDAPTQLSDIGHTYDGIAGDVLSESSTVTPALHALMATSGIEAVAEKLVGNLPEAVIARGIDFPGRADAVDRMVIELARHQRAVNPLASFFFWNRTRRDIGESVFSILPSTGLQIHTPYLDDDLFSLLAGILPGETVGKKLHTESIHRAYPQFAGIPFSSGNSRKRSRKWKEIMSAIGYFYKKHSSITARRSILLRLAIASVVPSRRDDVSWIVPTGVYLDQIAGLSRS